MAAIDLPSTHWSETSPGKWSQTSQWNRDPETWPVYSSLIEEPLVILVMGVTGSGKSNLVSLTGAQKQELLNAKTQRPVVGHSMTSRE